MSSQRCRAMLDSEGGDQIMAADVLTTTERIVSMRRFEYKVIDTGKSVEEELNDLGAEGWQVVGVTTKKQLLIAPPAAIILMRELH
jgi:hypothetical protein